MPNLASILKFFATPFENTLAMTLNGTIAPGATTVGVNNLGNYTNGQVVVFTIDAGTTSKQVFTGTVSGSNIVNVVWTYGTNVAHTDGAAIVDYVTATDFGMMSKGIQVQHNQDGTHHNITSDSIVNTGAFTQTGAMSLNGSWDGWIGANESWSFASSTTITVPTDATTKYDVGDYIKITQSATVKYFVIMSLTSTVLTVSGFNGVTVANSAITANAYSKARNPHGAALEYLSNLPFVQTQANAGTAGGTMFYVNLGGIKLLWGTTAQQSTTTASNFGVTFPNSFFTTIQTTSVSAGILGVTVQQLTALSSKSAAGINIYMVTVSGTGTMFAEYICIGT